MIVVITKYQLQEQHRDSTASNMAEEKERLQVNLLSKIRMENISWKISLSAVFWRQQQWERASLCGATLWRDLSQQGRVRVRGCQERCNRMIMSPNTLFFSLAQHRLLDCFGCLSTALAFSSWPRSWSEVKKLSWPPHVSLLRLAPGKGVRQFDVWGESSFKRPLPSYDKSDFSSNPLKVFKLAERNIIIQPTLLDDRAFLISLINWNVCCVKFWMQEGERRIICYLHHLFACVQCASSAGRVFDLTQVTFEWEKDWGEVEEGGGTSILTFFLLIEECWNCGCTNIA